MQNIPQNNKYRMSLSQKKLQLFLLSDIAFLKTQKGHQNLAAFNYWNKNEYLFFQFSIFYQIVVEKRDGLNAFEKRVEREVLVWRMNGIAIQTKTH